MMKMIDIGNKEITKRKAVAESRVYLKDKVIKLIKAQQIPKGDVLEAARIAGILAAKRTPTIIPLCHPIAVEYVEIKFSILKSHIKIISTVRGIAKTGFEMEALVSVSVAALTIYDMCKPLDKSITISDIKLLKKSGGKSGTYVSRN